MKLELISHGLCPFVHRAAIMLREKGVAFDRRTIDLENKPEWFLALSPSGKVPVLVADGIALFESAAICEFLDETHGPSLIPADPFARARQRAWGEVANDLLAAQFRWLGAADPAEAYKQGLVMDPLLDRLEEAIGAGVIAEAEFSLIHVVLAPALLRFVVVDAQLGLAALVRTPRLAALARRLARRPSVSGTVPQDFGAQLILAFVKRGSFLATSVRGVGPTKEPALQRP